jgi:hypothetical protein
MPFAGCPFTILISATATDVRNAWLTDVVALVVLAILEASKVSPRYRTPFSPPRVTTTGASAAGDVCALSRRHSVAAARIRNDALLVIESSTSMPRRRAAGYQLLYINAPQMDTGQFGSHFSQPYLAWSDLMAVQRYDNTSFEASSESPTTRTWGFT